MIKKGVIFGETQALLRGRAPGPHSFLPPGRPCYFDKFKNIVSAILKIHMFVREIGKSEIAGLIYFLILVSSENKK